MSSNSAVIALTGATGFVGRQVLDELAAGNHQIRALVRPGSRSKISGHDQIEWIEGRLGDPDSEHTLTVGADTVLHMAGLITARTKSQYESINSRATGTLARAARDAGVDRFIYLSSLAARAPELSWYAWSKHQGERELAANFPVKNALNVRAPAVFGAEDKATAPIFEAIRRGILPAPGGRNWRHRLLSLVHVDDLARFLANACVDNRHDGQIVSPSTRARINWPEFAENCEVAAEWKVRAIPIPLSILYPVAGLTTLLKSMTGKGHLTLGKLNEFLYDDWSAEDDLQSESDFQAALRRTIIEN